jgi:hypothetical protein
LWPKTWPCWRSSRSGVHVTAHDAILSMSSHMTLNFSSVILVTKAASWSAGRGSQHVAEFVGFHRDIMWYLPLAANLSVWDSILPCCAQLPTGVSWDDIFDAIHAPEAGHNLKQPSNLCGRLIAAGILAAIAVVAVWVCWQQRLVDGGVWPPRLDEGLAAPLTQANGTINMGYPTPTLERLGPIMGPLFDCNGLVKLKVTPAEALAQSVGRRVLRHGHAGTAAKATAGAAVARCGRSSRSGRGNHQHHCGDHRTRAGTGMRSPCPFVPFALFPSQPVFIPSPSLNP